jgi:hypothetical protein
MKPINEFTEQDGILINNEQESQEIREMLHGMGKTWASGDSYVDDWSTDKGLPCFLLPKLGEWRYLRQLKNQVLHPASDYIIKPGDEVEAKDFEDKTWFTNEYFVGKTLKGRLVCEDEEGQVSSWDLIRKAPSPKSKAIAEIKKIAEENGITVEIK